MTREIDRYLCGVGLFVLMVATWCLRRIGLFVPGYDEKLGGD